MNAQQGERPACKHRFGDTCFGVYGASNVGSAFICFLLRDSQLGHPVEGLAGISVRQQQRPPVVVPWSPHWYAHHCREIALRTALLIKKSHHVLCWLCIKLSSRHRNHGAEWPRQLHLRAFCRREPEHM